MDISIISKLVLDLANSKDVVFDSEITEIVKKQYPSFNDAYKNILIKQLRDMGIIYTYDVNMFKAYRGRVAFTPFINSNVEGKLNTFRSQNDFAISYFDTSIYNQLSSLQSVRSYLFIGVEAFAANYLIDKMEKEGKRVVTSNDLSKLRKYYSGINFNFDYVIKTINQDTPLYTGNNNFKYPKIETLLVDLVSDKTLKDLYSFDAERIFSNALKKYSIKINTLFRYAEKKKVKDYIDYILLMIHFDAKRGEFI